MRRLNNGSNACHQGNNVLTNTFNVDRN